jgi:hypothetical protein
MYASKRDFLVSAQKRKNASMNIMTNNRFLKLSSCVVLLIMACAAMYFMVQSSIIINGEHLSGAAGIGLALAGGLVAVTALFFVLILVGVLLAGAGFFLLVLLALISGSLLLVFSPLLLPFLVLLGLVMLMTQRRRA